MDQFKITIAGQRKASGDDPSVERTMPFLPRVGDYIGIDDHPDCSGFVTEVQYWWPEDDEQLQIEVRVK
jgi:hypothetical protein